MTAKMSESKSMANTVVESICDPKSPDPKKIASKGFIVLSDSARHGEFQKKSP